MFVCEVHASAAPSQYVSYVHAFVCMSDNSSFFFVDLMHQFHASWLVLRDKCVCLLCSGV